MGDPRDEGEHRFHLLRDAVEISSGSNFALCPFFNYDSFRRSRHLQKPWPGFISDRYEEMDDPWMANGLSATPFRHLISGCLSTVTVTKRVVAACIPLYARVSTFEELLALDDDELRNIIRSVAHYNRKTINLKVLCRQIIEEHGGEIPGDRESLLKLRGVGRKVADLMMNHVFSEDSIAVDTHVFRVLRRLEIVNDATPEQAADAINAITPSEYKRHAHEWLIQLGMQICHVRSPDCASCVALPYCPTGKLNSPIEQSSHPAAS